MNYTLSRMQKLIALGIAGLLVFLGGAYLWLDNRAEGPTSGIQVDLIDGLPEGATVEIVDRVNEDLFNSTPRPALDRTLPQGTASAAVYQAMLEQRRKAVALIEENPASMTQWLGLGILHKQAGDYEGARIYFTYVATVNPGNVAAHFNVGQLHQYYLKDAAKAEAAYRKAIASDATFVSAYSELYTLLFEQGKKDAAVAALRQGIAANADDLDLRVMLAHHFRTEKNIPQAKAAYDDAIAAARKAQNASLEASLATERAAL